MKKNVILILILLFTSSFNFSIVNADQKEVTYVVVYDEAHLQLFTHEWMTTALSSLNASFDTQSTDVTIDLIINEEAFTKSKLQGANLVIVPSPNLNDRKATNVEFGENFALDSFLLDGGSVFYLANPFSQNNIIAPHNKALEVLVADGIRGQVMLGSVENIDNDNATIIIDDDNNDGNSSHVYFDRDNLQFDIWKDEINDISRVLYYGSALDSVPLSANYGNASKYSYAIDKEYQIKNPKDDGHKWVSGSRIGQNDGRGVLIGSTIMFSDLSYNDSSSWVDVEDNLALFQNLVAWLLKITPLNTPQETITHDFSYFLTRNIFLSILIPLLLISLVFGLLIRSNSITFNKLFEFRAKRKRVTKKVGKAAPMKSPKKSTKKTTKKTRRKRD